MAAPSTLVTFLRHGLAPFSPRNYVWGRILHRLTFIRMQRCYRSTESSTTLQDDVDLVTEIEIEEDQAAKRDVSRLPKHLRDQMDHVLQIPLRGQAEFQQTRQYKRRLYARYGKASGVPANIMWPSKAELAETIEDEEEWEPTLQERWAKLKKQCQEEEEEIRKREELVEAQMAKMPEYIKKFREKLAKADEVEQQAQAKRKMLLDEAREYFGYAIDIHDPRFEKMKAEKEEHEKLEKRKAKKEEREARLLAHLKSLKEEADKEKAAALEAQEKEQDSASKSAT